MKGIGKKTLSLVLSFCMVAFLFVGLSPVALGAPGDVLVAGTDVSAGGYWKMDGGGLGPGGPDDYEIHYDEVAGKLTLQDAAINGDEHSASAIYSKGDLTIHLIGRNTVRQQAGGAQRYGIYTEGALTITAETEDAYLASEARHAYSLTDEITGNCGIYAKGGLDIQGGKIYAEGSSDGSALADDNWGIYVGGGDLTTTNSAIEAVGGSATYFSCGAYVNEKNITVLSGSFSGESGDSESISYGVYTVRGNITVTGSGSKLSGTSGQATGSDGWSCGVCVIQGEIQVKAGGNLDGASGEAAYQSCGVVAYVNSPGEATSITVQGEGSSLYGAGDQVTGEDGWSSGVYVYDENILVDGGLLVGTGGPAPDIVGGQSCGVMCDDSIIVEGNGKVLGYGDPASKGDSYGVRAGDDIQAIDGLLAGISEDASGDSIGVWVHDSDNNSPVTVEIVVEEEGSIMGASGQARYSFGVCADYKGPEGSSADITVNGGYLYGEAIDAQVMSSGIFADDDLIAKDAFIYGIGGQALNTEELTDSWGVALNGKLLAENSEIIGVGSFAAGEDGFSGGIGTYDSIVVNGGILHGMAGTAAGKSCGIESYEDISVKGNGFLFGEGLEGAAVSAGIYAGSEDAKAITLESGTLIGQGTMGLNRAPAVEAAAYKWRTVKGGAYTDGPATAYAWADTQAYGEVTTETNFYTVLVKGSTAGAGSGSGSYVANTLVDIDAGDGNGNSFEGWTVRPDTVILDDSARMQTFFLMPSEDVVVSAAWSYPRGDGIPRHTALNSGASVSSGNVFPFLDVLSGDWFYGDVLAAYKAGLINGRTAASFVPEGSLTIAETIKLAACMYELYTTGSITLTNGSPWYQTYVDYAVTKGIIKEGEYTEMDVAATRGEFAAIFAAALPEEAFQQKNEIGDDKIPDVKVTDSYGPSVYKLYRAGILQGNDAIGTFAPETNIKRSEAAAIVNRMMNDEQRKAITL